MTAGVILVMGFCGVISWSLRKKQVTEICGVFGVVSGIWFFSTRRGAIGGDRQFTLWASAVVTGSGLLLILTKRSETK